MRARPRRMTCWPSPTSSRTSCRAVMASTWRRSGRARRKARAWRRATDSDRQPVAVCRDANLRSRRDDGDAARAAHAHVAAALPDDGRVLIDADAGEAMLRDRLEQAGKPLPLGEVLVDDHRRQQSETFREADDVAMFEQHRLARRRGAGTGTAINRAGADGVEDRIRAAGRAEAGHQ